MRLEHPAANTDTAAKSGQIYTAQLSGLELFSMKRMSHSTL